MKTSVADFDFLAATSTSNGPLGIPLTVGAADIVAMAAREIAVLTNDNLTDAASDLTVDAFAALISFRTCHTE